MTPTDHQLLLLQMKNRYYFTSLTLKAITTSQSEKEIKEEVPYHKLRNFLQAIQVGTKNLKP